MDRCLHFGADAVGPDTVGLIGPNAISLDAVNTNIIVIHTQSNAKKIDYEENQILLILSVVSILSLYRTFSIFFQAFLLHTLI